MAVTQPPAQVKKRRARGRSLAPKLSRLHRPEELSLEAWQRELRRQFGREQKFLLKSSAGGHPVASEFEVTNPLTRNRYRVVIRGREPGNNFCSCPDFATNTLGTCKHVEFTLARLERKLGMRKALARGVEPPFTEVYLHYGARREVRFRPLGPVLAGLAQSVALGLPFLLAGAIKGIYDVILWRWFSGEELPEEHDLDHELKESP